MSQTFRVSIGGDKELEITSRGRGSVAVKMGQEFAIAELRQLKCSAIEILDWCIRQQETEDALDAKHRKAGS